MSPVNVLEFGLITVGYECSDSYIFFNIWTKNNLQLSELQQGRIGGS